MLTDNVVFNGERIEKQFCIAHGYFFIGYYFRPAEKRFYAEQQFVKLHGLGHIVVKADGKARNQLKHNHIYALNFARLFLIH